MVFNSEACTLLSSIVALQVAEIDQSLELDWSVSRRQRAKLNHAKVHKLDMPMKPASNALIISFLLMSGLSNGVIAQEAPQTPQTPAAEESTVKLPIFLETLKNAKQIEDSRLPANAAKSELRKAFEEAAKAGVGVKSDIIWLSQNASPAGRLYAVSLLKKIDPQAAKNTLEELKQVRENVTYKHGGEIVHYSVGEIAIDQLSPHPIIVIDLP